MVKCLINNVYNNYDSEILNILIYILCNSVGYVYGNWDFFLLFVYYVYNLKVVNMIILNREKYLK